MSADPEVKLAICIRALRIIYAGSIVTGRWYDEAADESLDDSTDAEAVPPGYYDAANPPADYDAKGWCGPAGGKPQTPLLPAVWTEYTADEQVWWISDCSNTASAALEKVGVPLVESAAGEVQP